MCQIDWADSDSVMLRAPRWVTGRKDHECDNCHRVVAKGERHMVGVWAGDDLIEVRYCSHCLWGARWLQRQCNGWLWGDGCLIEDLWEHWDDHTALRSLDLGRRIVGMRRQWRRFDGSGLMAVPQ